MSSFDQKVGMAFIMAFCLFLILGGIVSLIVHIKSADYNLIGPMFMLSVGGGIFWYLRSSIDNKVLFWGLLAASFIMLSLGIFQLVTGLDKQWRPAPRENGYIGIVLGSIFLVISFIWKKLRKV